MQENKRYFRVGLFAVISVIILVGALFFLGLAEEFEERLHFVTTFRESVQGLTKGAAVKFKGVPIGTVEKITILPNEQIIRVDMLIDPSVFSGLAGAKDSDDHRHRSRRCGHSRRSESDCSMAEQRYR